jgi:hypothetical protein
MFPLIVWSQPAEVRTTKRVVAANENPLASEEIKMLGGLRRSNIRRLAGAGAFSLLAAIALCICPAEASPIYNGGPIISGTPDVYFIWYGNWGTDSALSLLPSFVGSLSGTAYLGTDKTMGGNGLVNFDGSTFISSSLNSSLYLNNINKPTTQIESIVLGALAKDLLPNDPNGIYDVLTAPGVNVRGFNTQFCGYHDSTDWGGATPGIQFGFIGDPTASQTGCYEQGPGRSPKTSPNGNFGADAMASVIAHELVETVTDPLGTAWWDSQRRSSTYGYENSDMCAWNFGSVYQTSNGAYANYNSGGKNYLLQQLWVNTGGGLGYSGGHCGMSSAGSSSSVSPASTRGADVALSAPEPSTIAVMGMGLASLGGFSILRRRKKQAA